MKRKKLRSIAAFLVLAMVMQIVLAIPMVATANPAPDGFILISNAAELNNIRNNLTGRFRLTNDIHLTGWWTPIGTNSTGGWFEGILDGAGFTIHGLNVSGTRRVGLFGATSGVTIKNLHLRTGSIAASDPTSHAGSFVGYARGTLELRDVSSNLTVTGRNNVGGLVGYGNFSNADILRSEFYGTVTGNNYVGGIIGRIVTGSTAVPSRISQTRVVIDPARSPNSPLENQTIRVDGTGTPVGGIAGGVNGVTISQSYTTVGVRGTSRVGGIIGNVVTANNRVSIVQDSFSTGDIIGTANSRNGVGGIAGNFVGTSGTFGAIHRMERTYSTSRVHNERGDRTGGLVGNNGTVNTNSHILNSFAINREVRQSSSSTTPAGRIAGTDVGFTNNHAWEDMPIFWRNGTRQHPVGSLNNQHGYPIAYDRLLEEDTYTAKEWDFTDVWVMNPAVSPYPLLRWAHEPPPPATLELNPSGSIVIEIGSTATVTAGSMQAGDSIVWELDAIDPAIATVTQSGNTVTIVGRAEGEVTIRATTVRQAPMRSLTVYVEPYDPRLADAYRLITSLEIGQMTNLSGLTPTGQIANMSRGYTWHSSDPIIATVNSRGQVTAMELGLVEITATRGSTSISISILVREPAPVLIERIDFIPDSRVMLAGDNSFVIQHPGHLHHLPVIYPADATNQALRWETDNPNVAVVNQDGRILAVEPGFVTIEAHATDGSGVYGSINIRVVNTLNSALLTLVGDNFEIGDRIPIEYAVTGTQNIPGMEVTYDEVIWTFNPANAVDIDPITGQFTAAAPGNITATATFVTVGRDNNRIDVLSNTVHFTIVDTNPVLHTIADWRTPNNNAPVSGFPLRAAPHLGASGLRDIARGPGQNAVAGWNNLGYWYVRVSTSGLRDITVSSEQRGGEFIGVVCDFVLEYSIDNGQTWQSADNPSITVLPGNPQTWGAHSSTLPADAGNQGQLLIRWRLESAGMGAAMQSFIRNIVITGIGPANLQ